MRDPVTLATSQRWSESLYFVGESLRFYIWRISMVCVLGRKEFSGLSRAAEVTVHVNRARLPSTCDICSKQGGFQRLSY